MILISICYIIHIRKPRTFLFNHCYNLKLKDLVPCQKSTEFNIIGINLCNHSRINVSASVTLHENNSKSLFYFTDSALTSSSSECNLHIEYYSVLQNSILQKSPILESRLVEGITDLVISDNISIFST